MNNEKILDLNRKMDKWIAESNLDSFRDIVLSDLEQGRKTFLCILIQNFIGRYCRHRMPLDIKKQIYRSLYDRLQVFFFSCPENK